MQQVKIRKKRDSFNNSILKRNNNKNPYNCVTHKNCLYFNLYQMEG